MPASIAVTRPINPAGSSPTLTEEQVWKALEDKVRNPSAYVQAITDCQVTHEDGNKVTRTVTLRDGSKMTEEVDLAPRSAVTFVGVGRPNRVLNLISYGSEGELLLTYAFKNGIPGYDEQGELDVREQNKVIGKIVEHGIETMREMARNNQL